MHSTLYPAFRNGHVMQLPHGGLTTSLLLSASPEETPFCCSKCFEIACIKISLNLVQKLGFTCRKNFHRPKIALSCKWDLSFFMFQDRGSPLFSALSPICLNPALIRARFD